MMMMMARRPSNLLLILGTVLMCMLIAGELVVALVASTHALAVYNTAIAVPILGIMASAAGTNASAVARDTTRAVARTVTALPTAPVIEPAPAPVPTPPESGGGNGE